MKLVFAILLFFSSLAIAREPLKIAIVDTGIDLSDERLNDHFCTKGHKDFTKTGLKDTIGHGTFVAGLIEKYAGEGNYCLLIYKYYIPGQEIKNVRNEASAFKEAIKNGASIINFSAGGRNFSEDEFFIVRTNPKVTFVVAAGNDGMDLDIFGNFYYPASLFLKNEIILENINEDGTLADSSNWSDKAEKEVGQDVRSTLPHGKTGAMSGTSFSTAIRTGKIIRERLNAN